MNTDELSRIPIKYERILAHIECPYIPIHANACNTYFFAWYNHLQMTGSNSVPDCLAVVKHLPTLHEGPASLQITFCTF